MAELIRFITPDYKTLFYIEDGSCIRVTGEHETFIQKCRFLDDFHVRIGYETYHICQYAELLKDRGFFVVPDVDEGKDEGVWKVGDYILHIFLEGDYEWYLYHKDYCELIDNWFIESRDTSLTQAREKVLESTPYLTRNQEYLTRYPMDLNSFERMLKQYNM